MPTDAPDGNINAAVVMIAEKASDMILGRPALPPAVLETHLTEDPDHAGIAERRRAH